MDPNDVHSRQDEVQLIDVRDTDEWRAGRIPGARWIPMDELPDRPGEVDSDEPLVTVCRSGKRSGGVAEFLAGRGYRVDNLGGGMHAWADAGLPVRTPDDERPGKVA